MGASHSSITGQDSSACQHGQANWLMLQLPAMLSPVDGASNADTVKDAAVKGALGHDQFVEGPTMMLRKPKTNVAATVSSVDGNSSQLVLLAPSGGGSHKSRNTCSVSSTGGSRTDSSLDDDTVPELTSADSGSDSDSPASFLSLASGSHHADNKCNHTLSGVAALEHLLGASTDSHRQRAVASSDTVSSATTGAGHQPGGCCGKLIISPAATSSATSPVQVLWALAQPDLLATLQDCEAVSCKPSRPTPAPASGSAGLLAPSSCPAGGLKQPHIACSPSFLLPCSVSSRDGGVDIYQAAAMEWCLELHAKPFNNNNTSTSSQAESASDVVELSLLLRLLWPPLPVKSPGTSNSTLRSSSSSSSSTNGTANAGSCNKSSSSACPSQLLPNQAYYKANRETDEACQAGAAGTGVHAVLQCTGEVAVGGAAAGGPVTKGFQLELDSWSSSAHTMCQAELPLSVQLHHPGEAGWLPTCPSNIEGSSSQAGLQQPVGNCNLVQSRSSPDASCTISLHPYEQQQQQQQQSSRNGEEFLFVTLSVSRLQLLVASASNVAVASAETPVKPSEQQKLQQQTEQQPLEPSSTSSSRTAAAAAAAAAVTPEDHVPTKPNHCSVRSSSGSSQLQHLQAPDIITSRNRSSSSPSSSSSRILPPPCPAAAAAAAAPRAMMRQLEAVLLSNAPRLLVVDNFFDEALCTGLMELTRDRLVRSRVASGSETPSRTSWSHFFVKEAACHELVVAAEALIAALFDVPAVRGPHKPLSKVEALQVVKYHAGEFYHEHYDNRADSKLTRAATIIVYLCDTEEGGATSFPPRRDTWHPPCGAPSPGCGGWRLPPKVTVGPGGRGVKVFPVRGRALLFWSKRTDGSEEPNSIHAAETVDCGEKWIATRWMKDD